MPNFAQHAALARNPEFRERLQSALIQKSMSLLGADPILNSKIEGQRRNFAVHTLDSSGTFGLEKAAWVVGTNPTILGAYSQNSEASDILDGDIEYVLSQEWDLLANVDSAVSKDE